MTTACRDRLRARAGRCARPSGSPSSSTLPWTSTMIRDGETEDDVHVVLDEKHGDVLRQGAMTPKSTALSSWAHRPPARRAAGPSAGWRAPARSPAAAAGRRRVRGSAVATSPSRARLQDVEALVDRVALGGQAPPELPGDASRSQTASVTDSIGVRGGKQRVDLEGARQAALDPRVGGERGDVVRPPSRMRPESGRSCR